MISLKQLIKDNLLVIIFGIITLFFVGLGQTFFIAQFNHFFINDLNISRTELSSYYSLATFLASFNLSYIGALLDRVSLRKYLTVVLFFMSLGFILIANSYHAITIFLGFYLVRGFGQVSLGLMATTTAARLYGSNRGKIQMFMGLGRSSSEGILPLICVFFFSIFSWRQSLIAFVLLFLFFMIPILIFVIPKIPTEPIYEDIHSIKKEETDNFGWKDLFKLRWPLFVMLLNSFVPFIMTALFFQQDTIATFKGWDISIMAKSFIAFSIVHILGNLIWGPLVDKISARRLQPFKLIPILIGLLCLYFIDNPIAVYLYMGFVGLTIGLGGMVNSTFWAEVYGIKHLGKIKGMDSNIMVIGTSFAPIFYSVLIDLGYTVGNIMQLFIVMACFCILGYLLVFIHYRSYK